MSGEVDLNSRGSPSLPKTEPKGARSSNKGETLASESSSKGALSATVATSGATTSRSSTCTNASSINNASSSSPESHSISNEHAAVSRNASLSLNTTNAASSGGGGGVKAESGGKSATTLPRTVSSNPAVPCEGGAGAAPAFTCRSPRDSHTHNSNNSSSGLARGSGDIAPSLSPKPLTPNPSFEGKSHQNNQDTRRSSPPPLEHQEKTSSSSSLSARLSLRNLGRRRSPVRTQFTLPNPGGSTSVGGGTDQIPQDSISAQTSNPNISSTLGATGTCVSNSGGGQASRGLLVKSKKDRGASASPPLQRAQTTTTAPVPSSSLSSSTPASAAKASSTNPQSSVSLPSSGTTATLPDTKTATTTTTTVPADPNIPWVPGTSAPIHVDRAHSAKITRKILHNWRSACGRTKDRTKDLIRRWKTLPEHSEADELPPPTSSTAATSASPSKKNKSSNLTCNSPQLSKKKAHAVKSAEGATSTSSAGGPNKNEGSEFLAVSSELTRVGSGSSRKSVHHQQQQQSKTENEMPVVGIGKGVSSGGDGQGTNTTSVTGSGPGGAGTGRLSSGVTAIGRPSISVNNSLSVINGRTSTDGMSAGGGPSAGQSKSTTGWTVHVWATYVQRDDLEQGLENEEPQKPERDYLSDFQKVKLTHFFRHVLDMNHDDVISADDFVALNQRIRHYIEWSSECIEFHILKEVHSGFLECFLNQPLDECSGMYYCNSERETRQHVNIDEWLDVWGGLLRSARTMESLPLWLQYFPKILFQVINKSGSGTISREELRAFYTMFLGIDFRIVNDTLEAIYKAMTDGGRHKITYDLFKLCFANFLLGKYPNGPGQYLFGICSPQTLECSFPIDYSALNTHPDDLEPYDPEKDKSQSNRRSVIV